MARTYEQWVSLAEHRIRNILLARTICSQTQLEAKISEAGPTGSRPNPEVVREARRRLLDRGELKDIRIPGVTPVLYVFPSFSVDREKQRHDRIKNAYQTYERISKQPNLCGDVGEWVIYQAIIEAGSMHTIGGIKAAERTLVISGEKILDGKPLDFLPVHKGSSKLLGVEVKNSRQWYHQMNSDMWFSLAKCVSVKVLPVFVARKLDYLLFPIFSAIGCFGYQLHNQYFHPDVENELSDVRHKDGLGFADIRFPRQLEEGFATEPRHVKFFRDTIPTHIESFYECYKSQLPVLEEYLIKKRIWEDRHMDSDLVTEFLIELGVLEDRTAPDDSDYDYLADEDEDVYYNI